MVNHNYRGIEIALEKIEHGLHVFKNGELVSVQTGKRIGSKTGKGGYLCYRVYSGGEKHRVLVHRVVYAYHHGIEELKKHETIDHINGIKFDNRIENLEGVSAAENNARYRRLVEGVF